MGVKLLVLNDKLQREMDVWLFDVNDELNESVQILSTY